MTERETFIAAICANPADDTARLVYADWLGENGDPDRAEFVRVQCELWRDTRALVEAGILAAETPGPAEDVVLSDAGRRFLYLRRRERELLDGGGWQNWQGACCHLIPKGAHIPSRIEFRRGFVESVTCAAEDWLASGDAVLREHPVRRVTLTTWPDVVRFGTVEMSWEDDPSRGVVFTRWPGVAFDLPEPAGVPGLLPE